MNSPTFGDMIGEVIATRSNSITPGKEASSGLLSVSLILEAIESGHQIVVATISQQQQQKPLKTSQGRTKSTIPSTKKTTTYWQQMESTYRLFCLAVAGRALAAQSQRFKSYHQLMDDQMAATKLVGKFHTTNKRRQHQEYLIAPGATGASCLQMMMLCILLSSCLQSCLSAPTNSGVEVGHAVVQQHLGAGASVSSGDSSSSSRAAESQLELANRPSHQARQVASEQTQIIIPAAGQKLAANMLSIKPSTTTSSPSQAQPKPKPTTISTASVSEASLTVLNEEHQPLSSLIRIRNKRTGTSDQRLAEYEMRLLKRQMEKASKTEATKTS